MENINSIIAANAAAGADNQEAEIAAMMAANWPGVTVPVVTVSKADTVTQPIEGIGYFARRQFRKTDKVFGARESICSVIPYPFSAAKAITLVDWIMANNDGTLAADDTESAAKIAQAMIDALMAVQNDIYKDVSVNVDSKTIRDSVAIGNFTLAGIAAYLAENGSASSGGVARPADEIIEAVFNDVIATKAVEILSTKITDTDQLAEILVGYRERMLGLSGRKVLSKAALESLGRLLDASKDDASLAHDDKDAVLGYLAGRIKDKLAKLKDDEDAI